MKKIQFKATPQDRTETKFTSARLEVKAEGLPEGVLLHIKAYALAFNNIDSWGDIILPTACDSFLKSAEADRMALCWQHDMRTVIGKITDKGVDDHGMWIEADILPTTAGKDAAVLLKAGAVKEFSIGYRADSYEWKHVDGYDYDIRVLKEITVHECSPVTKAANPEAIVISAKSIEHESPETDPKEQPKNDNTISQTHNNMTPEEIKAMRESIEKAATEKVAAELAEKVKELKAAQEKIDAQDKSIDNLDKSTKALQATIDDLKKAIEKQAITSFKADMLAKLEEKRDEIKKFFDDKEKNFEITLELKTTYDIGTSMVSPNNFTSVAVDPTIHAAKPAANVFIEAFGIRPRTANKLGWIEATSQNSADYVEELAQNSNKSDVNFSEKSRKYGKLAHTMRISTEFEDWFNQLYNFCIGEGKRMLDAKLDEEIWKGLGADTANVETGASPTKIYGIKGQATAFSALGTYEDANEADVFFDAACQIAKEHYRADSVFVTWATWAILNNLKDKDGNRLFNQATQMLGGLRVYPTDRLSAGEALVADTGCAEPHAGNSYELEFIRNGVYDAYDVYFRRAAQVKVTTPAKKGLIYIASLSTAKAAVNVAGPLTKLASAVDTTDSTIKTKAAAAANA